MTRPTLTRTAAFAALVVMTGLLSTGPASPADPSYPVPSSEVSVLGDGASKFVPIGVSKTVVVDLPRDAKDVLVADPSIANAVMRTSRRVYLIGVKVGQTNIHFFDHSGRQIVSLDIAVTRDLNGIRAALKRALPHANINVEGIGEDGVMLTGTVANAAESQLAYDLASRLVSSRNAITSSGSTQTNASGGNASSTTTSNTTGDSGSSAGGVVNGLTILGRDQVMLKVTVAEVQRDVIKQLGINLDGSFSAGNSVINFNTDNPFTALGQPLSATSIRPSFGPPSGNVRANIRAMERAGVIRTLAEPNLTAISGESANFLAGGEFPVPAGRTCDPQTGICQDQIQWKKFGVSLTFTPVVLTEGRISLRVGTEVSELSTEQSVQIQGLNIPSLRVRRAETTVEIPSGGSLAMAGMIQEATKQQINGLPGLLNLPVLGALFKSRDYVNRQSELVVLVTPYVVRAVAQKKLSRPDDGFADASDASTTLLGRFNKLYGVPGKSYPKRTYRGNYGFILD